jgi:hypothetical protein
MRLREVEMKKPLLSMIALAALAAVLVGCVQKAVWKPLFGTPIPGRTSSLATPESAASATPDGEAEADKLFSTDVESMDSPKIVVYKSKHTLEVWDGKVLMARMQIAIGKGDAGPKQKNGDNKTPEGAYYICKTSDKGKYYKSLFLSYPNADDANAGLTAGLITQTQYDSITQDIGNGKQPAWDTALGGEIAISGTGTIGDGKTGDWTVGNIALSDKDMDYVWKYIDIGADVEINP